MNLTEEAARTLTSVLDTIVPPSADGRLAGAGELGLASHIDEVIGESPELQPIIESGLAAVQTQARARGATDFAALGEAERREVLDEIDQDQPGLLPSLSFHTFVGYYQHDRVVGALGLEPRPPHPKGYELPENDLSLLDAVRTREKLYRE